jgi:uncharacterized protein (DUF1697 family)
MFLLFSMTPKIQNQVIHLLKTQSKLLQTKTKQRENFKIIHEMLGIQISSSTSKTKFKQAKNNKCMTLPTTPPTTKTKTTTTTTTYYCCYYYYLLGFRCK